MNGETLLQAVLATLVALTGAAFGVLAAGRVRRGLGPLVGVAGGAMLAVTAVSLLPEAWRLLRPLDFAVSVASGYLLLYLIGRYVAPVCPACAAASEAHEVCGCGDSHDHHDHHDHPDHHDYGDGDDDHRHADAPAPTRGTVANTSLLLAAVLTLHSFVDGMALAGAHGGAHHHHHGPEGLAATLPMLLAVCLHKMPEGLALAALLLSAGYAPLRAFLLTAAVEATTLLGGALGGMFFAAAPPLWLGAALAHVGGSFLYLVFHGLLGGLLSRPLGSGSALRRALPEQAGYGAIGFAAVALLLWSLLRLQH
jgi:Predicted divalent heavy-metal cations transporter